MAENLRPEGLPVTVGTVLTALALGIGTVSVAPLLTLRRFRRTDIPAALRVAE